MSNGTGFEKRMEEIRDMPEAQGVLALIGLMVQGGARVEVSSLEDSDKIGDEHKQTEDL